VGIYDREYYRDERPQGFSFRPPRTIVGLIILLNVVLWLIDMLADGRLSDLMAVRPDTLAQPWLWWQFLTAGFAHSPVDVWHILGNMLVLFFLGRDVEEVYGRKEFLRVYLVMVVFASVVWAVAGKLTGTPGDLPAIGASGAITGVVVLYAFNFPRRTLLLYFVIPIPAWLLGVMVVVMAMVGQAGHGDAKVAYTMHLAGAAFALLYYQLGWNLTRLTADFHWPKLRRRPKLRIHEPDEEPPHPDLRDEVDRILEKIYRDGESSLTPRERKTLETASKEFQQRKK
jgi:membrane associated rhomboid family serine protease